MEKGHEIGGCDEEKGKFRKLRPWGNEVLAGRNHDVGAGSGLEDLNHTDV